jgi:exonuclease III
MQIEVKFVTWNVRGLSNVRNRGDSFAYLRLLRADIIALQETHARERDHDHWSQMWGGPAAWTSHVGLLLREDAGLSFVSEPVSSLGGRVLSAKIKGDPSLPTFTVHCVYAPANEDERNVFITRLRDVVWSDANTILLGDLNAAPMPALDRWPNTHHTSEWKFYRELMREHRLVDLYRYHCPTSRLWTWTRTTRDQTAQVSRSRIDHMLVSPRLAAKLSRPVVDIPPRSDHRPLITIYRTLRSRQPGRTVWRLNATHLEEASFVDSVRTMCEAFAALAARQRHQGNVELEVLHAGWARLKERVKQESMAFGVARSRRQSREAGEQKRLLQMLQTNPPDPNTVGEEARITWTQRVQELESALAAKARARVEGLRIRSRAKWTEQGERSTAYFFRRLRARLATAHIDRLTDENGREVTDDSSIFGVIERFYSRLFEQVDTNIDAQNALLRRIRRRISDETRVRLDRDIEVDEILEAIRTAPANSAPGPDGITFEFYKKFAEQLAPALATLYNESRVGGSFPLSFRQTHIILLPKKGDLKSLVNWRPISLSDCDIKILTRVLTHRMHQAAEECIHESQTGFIQGRSIFDNLHTIHLALQCGKINPALYAGVIMLLDQQKAYDRVDRSYLDRCLECFGIGLGFRSWLTMMGDGAQAKVRSGAKFSDWIPVRKGLRQGDPLSPLLYNFVLEPLLCTLRETLDGIRLPGYTLRTLAFADDVAVAVSSERDLLAFNECIRYHEQASAARLNVDKTVVLQVGQPQFETPVQPLRPQESTRYLGILFSSEGLDVSTMEAKLLGAITETADRWQSRRLSLVGRTLLANTCMLAKLWFAARIVPFSKEFEQAVRARIRHFVWGSRRGRVPEDVITRSKHEGGLGLLPICEQALAIFSNFVTRIFHPIERPEWSPMAYGLLNFYLRRSGQDISEMYCQSGNGLKVSASKSIPTFWQRVIQIWNKLDGQSRALDDTWHPLEVLTVPLRPMTTTTTPVYREYRLSNLVYRTSVWRAAGAYTVGDVIEWSEQKGTYVTRDTDAARAVTADWAHYGWTLSPELLQLLKPLRYPPSTGPPAVPFSKLMMMGEGIEKCRPRRVRKHLRGKKMVKPRADRWADHSVNECSLLPMLSWSAVFSPRLEPKHQSLLWLMQHGAVVTARVMVHIRPETTANCPVCDEAVETLRHYFFECRRAREFWRLVGDFLDRIQASPATTPTPMTLKDILSGLPAWKDKVPSLIVFYAQAVWQIYRSHAESALDNVHNTATGMFAQWQYEMMQRVLVDLNNAKRNNRIDQFRANWLSIRCQWFVFDSGGEVPERGKVVFNDAFTTPMLMTSMTEATTTTYPSHAR